MKKAKPFSKSFFRILVLTMAVILCVSCNSGEKNDGDDPNIEEDDLNILDLRDFKIIRDSASGSSVAAQTALMKKAIQNTVGLSLTVNLDDDTEPSAKEILIGDTDREATKNALKKLDESSESDAYIIDITDSSVAIIGKSEQSTVRAIKVFEEKYIDISPKGNGIVIDAGNTIIGDYDVDKIIYASNGAEIEIELKSSVFEVPENKISSSLTGNKMLIEGSTYPSIVKLAHQSNKKDNGKLIAIFRLEATPLVQSDSNTRACVMMSDDDGETWKCIARPEEEFDTSLPIIGDMGHIYELPAQVGDMPAGTLLYSANSVNYKNPGGRCLLAVWRSFDCGKSWEQYVCIDEGGGLEEGVWEPFMIYCEEDKYLYCFYSDDSDPKHSQKIAYKRSKDGVLWEGEDGKVGKAGGTGIDVEPVDVIAYKDFSYRPGMPVITKMGNGEYLMVFELFGDWDGCPIFYKTTKDLSDWGDPNDYGKKIVASNNYFIGSGPSCAWVPYGSECGTLVVTGKYGTSKENDIFLSFDYGETWETVENPLYYTDYPDAKFGYSPGLWVDGDGKIYYVNTTNSSHTPQKTQIAFARIKIY